MLFVLLICSFVVYCLLFFLLFVVARATFGLHPTTSLLVIFAICSFSSMTIDQLIVVVAVVVAVVAAVAVHCYQKMERKLMETDRTTSSVMRLRFFCWFLLALFFCLSGICHTI